MTRRVLVLIGLLLQLLGIFGLFLPQRAILSRGTPVTLRTMPVDPRSLFRGDYVILQYEAGQGLPENWDGPVVYAVLRKNGDVFERVRFEKEKPVLAEGEVCLRGTPQWNMADFPDLAQYFVPEGEGREIEDARNQHRLFIDAVVDDRCNAVIMGLRLGPEEPLEPLEPEVPSGLLRPIPQR